MHKKPGPIKTVFLYLMALLYTIAGLNHFMHPQFYTSIMPPWLPAPELLIYFTGICEVLFALLLLPLNTRRAGAWLLIILLVAIFPANIQMAVNYWRGANPYLWIAILRLPLQAVLIWWAWIYTRKGSGK